MVENSGEKVENPLEKPACPGEGEKEIHGCGKRCNVESGKVSARACRRTAAALQAVPADEGRHPKGDAGIASFLAPFWEPFPPSVEERRSAGTEEGPPSAAGIPWQKLPRQKLPTQGRGSAEMPG